MKTKYAMIAYTMVRIRVKTQNMINTIKLADGLKEDKKNRFGDKVETCPQNV